MRMNLVAVHQNFLLESDQLMRIMSNGALRKVPTVVQGKIRVLLDGVYLSGPEVAWALHYGIEPQFPLLQVDGDPFNLSAKNLLPIRGIMPRCRITWKGRLCYHSLGGFGYADEKSCRKSWQLDVYDKYSKDLAHVLSTERKIRDQRGLLVVPPKPVRKYTLSAARAAKTKRTPKPEHIWGKVWVWFEDAWLSIPEATHPSDDWMVRAASVKAANARALIDQPQSLPAEGQAQPA